MDTSRLCGGSCVYPFFLFESPTLLKPIAFGPAKPEHGPAIQDDLHGPANDALHRSPARPPEAAGRPGGAAFGEGTALGKGKNKDLLRLLVKANMDTDLPAGQQLSLEQSRPQLDPNIFSIGYNPAQNTPIDRNDPPHAYAY
jgi:hypothetical protein